MPPVKLPMTCTRPQLPMGTATVAVLLPSLVMLAACCSSSTGNRDMGRSVGQDLDALRELLHVNGFELVIPPRSDRTPGTVLLSDAATESGVGNVGAAVVPPVPAWFLQGWVGANRAESDSGLLCTLPSGGAIDAALRSKGMNIYTLAFGQTSITTLGNWSREDVDNAPADTRRALADGAPIILESLSVSEATLDVSSANVLELQLSATDLDALGDGKLAFTKSGQLKYQIAVRAPVVQGVRKRATTPTLSTPGIAWEVTPNPNPSSQGYRTGRVEWIHVAYPEQSGVSSVDVEFLERIVGDAGHTGTEPENVGNNTRSAYPSHALASGCVAFEAKDYSFVLAYANQSMDLIARVRCFDSSRKLLGCIDCVIYNSSSSGKSVH